MDAFIVSRLLAGIFDAAEMLDSSAYFEAAFSIVRYLKLASSRCVLHVLSEILRYSHEAIRDQSDSQICLGILKFVDSTWVSHAFRKVDNTEALGNMIVDFCQILVLAVERGNDRLQKTAFKIWSRSANVLDALLTTTTAMKSVFKAAIEFRQVNSRLIVPPSFGDEKSSMRLTEAWQSVLVDRAVSNPSAVLGPVYRRTENGFLVNFHTLREVGNIAAEELRHGRTRDSASLLMVITDRTSQLVPWQKVSWPGAQDILTSLVSRLMQLTNDVDSALLFQLKSTFSELVIRLHFWLHHDEQ